MSYCKKDGKDEIIFASKEDLEQPSLAIIELEGAEDDDEPGLILPNGEINWSCPCLGGMASGPCGTQFRDAFSCFHHSTAEPKGSDCFENFRKMQDCMACYPELYPASKEGDEPGKAMAEINDNKVEAGSEKRSEVVDDDKSSGEIKHKKPKS